MAEEHELRSWSVLIDDHGRSAWIHYLEGAHEIGLDAELLSSPGVLAIWAYHADRWDELHPWAAGRRAEVLKRVADDVIRQKAPGCRARFDVAAGMIEIHE